jgi:hypothetical protein
VEHGAFSCMRGYEQRPVQGRRRAEDIKVGREEWTCCAWGPSPILWGSFLFDRRGVVLHKLSIMATAVLSIARREMRKKNKCLG